MLSRRLDRPGIWRVIRSNEKVRSDLERIEIHRPEDVLALYMLDRDGVLRITRGTVLNTDDNMRVEYSAPLHLHEDTLDANSDMVEAVAEVAVDAVEGTDGLLALARAYSTYDDGWRRVLSTMAVAKARSPEDPSIDLLYSAYQEAARLAAEGEE